MKRLQRIDKRNTADVLALTPLQEGMLFHYLKTPASDLYVVQLTLEISGDIDVKIFEKAWNIVVETNEMLRTIFRWKKIKHPLQMVLKKYHLKLIFHDLSSIETSEKNKIAEEIKINDRKKKFDLREVPFRVLLCKIEANKYQMIVSNHHILYDGWSNGIILKEFFNVYHDLTQKRIPATPVKNKFKEYIKWIKNQDKNKLEKFWRNYLKGVEEPTEQAVKTKTKEKECIRHPGKYHIRLSQDIINRVERFTKRHKITLAALLYSTWGILLQKYNNSDDVLFGTTVSGRSVKFSGIENMVGLFINTLPLRVKKNPHEIIIDVLNRINHTLQVREEYEAAPLVDIIKYTPLGNTGELFDSLVVIENYPLERHLMKQNNKLSIDSYSMVEVTNYDLTLEIVVFDDIDIDFVYNRECFEPGIIKNLSGHFYRLMENIIKKPAKKIHEIEILSEKEKQQLLVDFNDTATDYPRDKTILDFFSSQLEKTPDSTALVGGNSKSQIPNSKHGALFGQINACGGMHISYQELNEKSDQLAQLLVQKGIKPDSIVGIMMERSIEMIVGILGIIKAGGAYLPIDPGYPKERIDDMLKDSSTKILLKDNDFTPEAFKFCPKGTSSHQHLSPWVNAPVTLLAYIIYTSGSTGQPKGVMIQHNSLLNQVIGLIKKFGFDASLNYILLTRFTFDVSIMHIFLSLTTGAKLFLATEEVTKDPVRFWKFLNEYKIDVLNLVPSHLKILLENNKDQKIHVKYLFVGGEVFNKELYNSIKGAFSTHQIINIYGPTETTINATLYHCEGKKMSGTIPIGRPLINYGAYILDHHLNLVPIGVKGELCISGKGVARGYLNRPELTAEKFYLRRPGGALFVKTSPVKHLDSPRKNFLLNKKVIGKRIYMSYMPHMSYIYRTGDLARWLTDGNIEFLGRIDHQVKIRGFRIETAEIESHLKNDHRIREAIVVEKQNQKADKYLCAYIVTNETVEISQLKTRLAAQLPDYMIPYYFVSLDKLPLTPTGKIDRKALPEPGIKSEMKYIPPRNQGEKLLVEIWSHVLEIEKDKIGIDDHFFELGGHSLTAIRLISRINQAFDIEVSISRLFNDPTIRGIHHYIKKTDPGVHQALNPAEKKEYYPLSPSQKRLHFLQQTDLESTAYNMPYAMMIEGDVTKDKLQDTFRKLIHRHGSFRTSFEILDDQPFQRIHNEVDFEIEPEPCGQVFNACGEIPQYETKAHHSSFIIHHSFVRPFDLSQVPLLRVGLIELPHTPAALRGHPSQEGRESRYILMVDMHHIISDGISTSILIKEFAALFANARLPGLRLQYNDYSEWQNKEKDSESMKQQENYWLKQFAIQEERRVLNLPFDYPRPMVRSFAGETLHFEIGRDETTALKSLALKEDVTLFMLLLSIYIVLLSKLCNQQDITVGIPIAARRHTDLRGIMGMFVNTLVLQNFLFPQQSFSVFLKKVKKKTLKAYENQEYPFENLVEKVEANRDASRNPLFDVMFVLQNMEVTEVEIPGLKLKPYEYENRTSKFDMTLIGEEKNKKLFFTVEYCTKLFKQETILRFSKYFKKIVYAVLHQTEQEIFEIEIIPGEEKKQVLYDFNETGAEYPRDKTIHRLFAQQVQQTPDYIALQGCIDAGMQEEGHITYDELNKKSNQLAFLLKEKGVKPDTIAAIMPDRSVDMIIGILGILKTGGAYLPIEPGFPPRRIQYMLEDSNAQVLVVDDTLCASWLSFAPQALLNLSQGHHLNFLASQLPSFPASLPSSLAYIIYTSGSTGKPKGVMVTHTSAVNVLSALQKEFPLKETDAYLLKTSVVFDVSVTELFGWFFGAGRLVILEKNGEKDPDEILDTIERTGITHINFVPSMFNTFVEVLNRQNMNKLSGLRYFFLAGEVLLPGVVNKFKQLSAGIQLENIYGPTEGTVYSSKYPLSHWDGRGSIPIGKPIRNIRLYILDRDNHLQPIGVPGELHISGVGLARGYVNQPGLTAEKFAEQVIGTGDSSRGEANFNKKFLQGGVRKAQSAGCKAPCAMRLPPGCRRQKIYKTGDLARWLPDGNIEFLGRIDYQVKIRGFRIELGEIEAQLLERLEIKEAVVVARENKPREKLLCAYIVSQSESNPHDLRHYLAGRLPDYMIPSYFILLDKIPLTPNGKVNKKALPKPEIEVESIYAAPVNQIQEKLVEIWSRVLGIEEQHISIDSNFFRLGGHSLNAAVVISKIHKVLNVKLSLDELFNFSTIRGLSAIIAEAAKDKYIPIEPVEKKDYYTLSSAQMRLFILQQLEPNSINYNISQLLVLESTGESDIDISRLERTFNRLVLRHESLRTSFKIIDDQPVQRIHDQVNFKIEYDGAKRKRERFAPSAMRCASTIKDFIRPFDLAQAPLLRVGLMELPQAPAALRGHPSQEGRKHKYILKVDMHHIISDGVSMGIIIEDFIPLYTNAQISGLRLQYRDYSQWQNKTKDSKRIKQQEEYWLKQFDGEIPVLNLPIDYPRTTIQSFAGNDLHFEIGMEDTKALKSLATKEEVTLFMLLLSITNILFSKLSSQDQVILGTPIAARKHADLQGIIGMFVNTLVLQNRPDGEKTFKQFLNEVKKRTLGAYENQEYPFEKLVEKVSKQKDTSRNPLFDVIFALQNMGVPELEIPGLKLKPYEYGNKVSKFDLAFNGVEKKGRLVYTVEYCTRLFKKETILRFIKCFKRIVSAVIEKPGQKISGISIIPDDERRRILYGFNDTKADYPKDKTIHQLFKEQVEQTPDNIAVVAPQQTKNRTYMTYTTHISYHELNEKSNQLTYLLIEKGVKPDTIVAIMMERSLEMVIGLLGILNAGGAYLPIDPEYPEDRITYMLKDSGAEILLNDNHFTPEAFNNRPKGASPHLHLSPWINAPVTSLAYVIYTSGTTGRPKGVLVMHQGLVNMIFAYRKVFGENQGSRVSQSASPAFDAMAFEIWPCLSNSAALYIVDDESRVDPAKMKKWLIEKQITISFQPTIMAEKLLDETWPEGGVALKSLPTGGDRLTRNPDRPYPFTLYNLYGPTEDTVWTTWTEVKVKPNPGEFPSIGKPVDNHQVYIVSPNMQLHPIGVPGELCIAGDGLAKGYLNQPELTTKKLCLRQPGGRRMALGALRTPPRKNFLLKESHKDHMQSCNHAAMQPCSHETIRLSPHYPPQYPITPSLHHPIYRTGDLALWLWDGNIQFLGRSDHQIKIRGFRIELSEIEKNLLTHEGVNEAVVAAKERENKGKYLCAYIVSHPRGTLAGGSAMVKELRAHLSRMLPHYMVPTYFVQLQQIPITPNGKVDRKALPEPDIGNTEQENIPPRNLVERKLVEIWSGVLGIGKDNISIAANFFEIGGHSLNAEMVRSRIHKELNVKLPLAEIFKTPTIKELSPKIQEAEKSEFSDMEPVEQKEYYELSYNQKRLWFLHCLQPANLSYHILGWLRFSHTVNTGALQRAVSGIFSRHESFRTGFKKIRGQPVQFVREKAEISFQTIDISRLTENEKQQKTKEIIEQITAQPFDLQNPPLFRSILIKQEDEAFSFVYNMHHIISDGWSMGIVKREFHRLYNKYAKGNQWDPQPVPYQYKDFAAWHNKQIRDSELRRAALRYWKKVIETGLPVLKLPYYYSGSPEDKRGAGYRCTINQTSKEKLLQLAKDNNTTLSTLLFTLYNLLFAYLSGQKEIVTIIISAGRVHSALDMAVGYFINPVIVKIDVDLRGDFEELLSGVNRKVLEALQHQNYPFEKILDDLKISYPNIPASFNFISMQDIDMEIEPDSEASHHIREKQEVKFPLGLFPTEYKNGIEINWDYQKTMFEPGTIENTAKKYLDLVIEVTESDE